MCFPKRTKLVLSLYLEGTRFRRLLAYAYLYFSKYKLVNTDKASLSKCKYLFIISHERLIRNDHLSVFEQVFNESEKLKPKEVLKLEYKRVLSLTFSNFLLLFNKSDVYDLLKCQMDEVLEGINFSAVKNLTVFCDTSPLQNYIVEYCNKIDIQTISMQHGFYPLANNDYWRKVYLASNAATLAVWDQQTMDCMIKYSTLKRKRFFLKVGPISSGNRLKKNSLNRNRLERIAVFSCGIDQKEANAYLVSLVKFIKDNSNLKVFFICHPFFNVINRVNYTLKTGIVHYHNRLKCNNYDCHLVLNSSIWLELEQENLKYIRLDEFYAIQEDFKKVLEYIYSYQYMNNVKDDTLRKPFYGSEQALKVISSYITNCS